MTSHAEFCERNYAINFLGFEVKEFWNVVTILAWIGFYGFIVWQRLTKRNSRKQSICGDMYVCLVLIHYLDGVMIHATNTSRWLHSEIVCLLTYSALYFEAQVYLPLISVLLPIAPRILKLLNLVEDGSASLLNKILNTPTSPAFEALLGPVIFFVVGPAINKTTRRVFLKENLFTVVTCSFMLSLNAFGRYLESQGMCHLLNTGFPIVDEFFTPHNVLDHCPSLNDYQIAILLDALVARIRQDSKVTQSEKPHFCNASRVDYLVG